jgi:hypothetical protein
MNLTQLHPNEEHIVQEFLIVLLIRWVTYHCCYSTSVGGSLGTRKTEHYLIVFCRALRCFNCMYAVLNWTRWCGNFDWSICVCCYKVSSQSKRDFSLFLILLLKFTVGSILLSYISFYWLFWIFIISAGIGWNARMIDFLSVRIVYSYAHFIHSIFLWCHCFLMCSKPQLIDAALLRPGRFDRLVFCDFPRWDERLEILKVHSRTVRFL